MTKLTYYPGLFARGTEKNTQASVMTVSIVAMIPTKHLTSLEMSGQLHLTSPPVKVR
jgi:hypothetical protein